MPAPKLRTVAQWIGHCARRMERAGLHFGHGTGDADDEAFALVRWVLKLPVRPPPANSPRWSQPVAARDATRIRELLDRRIKTRQPLAYLTGEAWFAGLRFAVDERVLVPRSPIAELIANKFQPWLTRSPRRILDLCSGSGCIAVACAKAFPSAKIDAVEIDTGALQVLEKNIGRHRLRDRVRAVKSDLFEAVRGRYDLIVSNPPYVPGSRMRRLPAEHRFEPPIALVAGKDGMDLVARILAGSPEFLRPGGTLVCEIGGYAPEFMRRFPSFPAYWPEFEMGGDGVFVVSREELEDWQADVR